MQKYSKIEIHSKNFLTAQVVVFRQRQLAS